MSNGKIQSGQEQPTGGTSSEPVLQGHAVAVVVACLLIAGILWIFRAQIFGGGGESQGIDRAMHRFVSHLVDGEFELAHGLLDPESQRRIPLGSFRDAVASNGSFSADVTEFAMRRRTRTGATAMVEGVLKSPKSDVALVTHFKKTDHEWRVTEVVVSGSPILSPR